MNHLFSNFEKKQEYLICIDSDGCAIDSMDIKHFRCFGPCMIDEWHLEDNGEEILNRWNQINLYSMTRGINRFKGLAKALVEIDQEYLPVEDVRTLAEWTQTSDELSNAALKRAIEMTGSICLKKALRWSEAVNEAITRLPEVDVTPFRHVRECISLLHKTCDIAIVSSANYEAVKDEWSRFGLLDHVDILLAQNAGSKSSCIAKLLSYGYQSDHVLMVGDAPGDMAAAEANNVFYYPILVRKETESWEQLEKSVQKMKNGTFAGKHQNELKKQFTENLTI